MQIELRDYFNVLRRRWWLILLVALGAAAGGYGYSKLQAPTYEAMIQLQLVPNRPDNGLIEFLRKNITSYTAGLGSRDFINSVLTANRSDLDDLNTDDVLARLKVQAQPDNSMLVMTVDDSDPRRAAALANALADAYALQSNAAAQSSQSDMKIFMQKVDTARPPDRPSQPRTTLNTAAAGLLGLVLGLILAFAIEFTDTTLKTADDVQRYLGLNTVGLIPAEVAPSDVGPREESGPLEKQSKPAKRPAADDLVMLTDPRSAAAEAYRTLRVNIQFASPDKPLRTLLATSTSPEDGKSTTIANLAIALAETGAPTLLVDCDLRRPSLHLLFGLANDVGLTSLMLAPGVAAPAAEPVALPLQATAVPNLRLLPSGPLPPNPAEILASRRMAELLATLAGEATFVLFDTPPVIAVADAAVLAPRVDGVLLVVRAGRTRRDLALKARKMLEQAQANVIGVVLTGATLDRSAYAYYGTK